jgi:hypothetical protein
MIGQAQPRVSDANARATLFSLVADDGSAAHRHLASDAMMRGPDAARNAADAVHHLALLHARHPGVIDHAVSRTADPQARAVIAAMASAFAAERALLARLVVAVGPVPSTPGQADAESAVLAQHHAIDMLGLSDRNGCATGAALALIAEWAAIRPMFDHCAGRLGVDAPDSTLASPAALEASLAAADFGIAAERAMLFGAQQIVAQHRGLWDLLEARALARAHY